MPQVRGIYDELQLQAFHRKLWFVVIMSPFLDVRHDVTGCPIRELKDVITTEAIQGAARIYCPNEKACEDPLASPVLCTYISLNVSV